MRDKDPSLVLLIHVVGVVVVQIGVVIVAAQNLYLLIEHVVMLAEVEDFLLPQMLLARGLEVDLDRHLKLQFLIAKVVVLAEMKDFLLPQVLPQMLFTQPGKIDLGLVLEINQDPLLGLDLQLKLQFLIDGVVVLAEMKDFLLPQMLFTQPAKIELGLVLEINHDPLLGRGLDLQLKLQFNHVQREAVKKLV